MTFQVKKSRSGFRIEIEWVHEENEIYIPEEVIRELQNPQRRDWVLALADTLDLLGNLLGGNQPSEEEKPVIPQRAGRRQKNKRRG